MPAPRSPFLAAVPAALALAAGGVRWAMQGSGNLYTAIDKRFYVEDKYLGWRVQDDGPVWLGLEILAIIAAVVVGILVVGLLLRRWERTHRPVRWLRPLLWLGSVATLAVPVLAFASGFGPAGGHESLPAGASAAAPTTGIEGDLGAPAGRYEVIVHSGSAVVAKLKAGGDTFEARFAHGITGTWTGDAGDLTRPMTATISVPAASVDTGIEQRSKHAREEYLYADKFPALGFTLDKIVAARQDAPDLIAFRAAGRVALMGREHPVEVTGTLRALDAEGARQLGLAGEAAVLVARADLALSIKETALVADADSFDVDAVPITATLVLVHRP